MRMISPSPMARKVSISIMRIATFSILWLILGASFFNNFLKISAQEDFISFQKDSESLVLGPIVAETLGIGTPTNLGFIYPRGGGYPENIFDSYQLLGTERAPKIQTKIVGLQPCGSNCSEIQIESFPKNSEIYIGSPLVFSDGQTGTINRLDPKSNSLRLFTDQEDIKFAGLGDGLITLGGPTTKKDLIFADYKSTYGLQGLFWKLTKITDIPVLKQITASASSLLIISLIFLIYFRVNRTLALSFAVSLFFSPWITKISNNLYWSLGSWIAPLIFAILFAKAKTKQGAIVTYAMLTASFFVKFAQGFEFTSTLILAAIGLAMFAADPTSLGSELERFKASLRLQLNFGIKVFHSGFFAFIGALLLLSPFRGSGVWDGLKNIFIHDVLRRTYGNPNEYDSSIAESLAAPVSKVIGIYILNWSTPVLNAPLLTNLSFVFWIILGIASFTYLVIRQRHEIKIQLLPLMTLFLSSFSWLILAKGHSYIHTHINFVLFYLGTIPVLIYMCICALKAAANNKLKNKKARLKSRSTFPKGFPKPQQ